MNDLIRWIIGLKESPDWAAGGSWRIEYQSLPHGLWGVASAVLFLAAAGGVWWLYKKEGRSIGTPMRLVLGALRMLILTGVIFILLEMVLVITKTERVPSHLLVLVDTSESMGLGDPYTDEEVARRTASQFGLKDEQDQPNVKELRKRTRLSLAQGALDELVGKLADGRAVSVYGFGAKLDPVADDAARNELRPTGADTAIGDALKNALAAHRGQPLAGVLLVSDGQSNAGSDPRQIAQQAGKDGVIIHALAAGTEQGPSNARLADIEASPVVFVKDSTEIGVLVESHGLEGHAATVTLEQRQEGGAWSDVGREEIVLGDDAAVRRLMFKVTPDLTGQYDFRATISDAGDELTEADNTAVHSMKVVRQRIRVLLIAGYPSPEVQFIRNALLRDPMIEFASWLQSAGDGYEHIGHRPIRRLPIDQKELEQYDVLILFDPDMRALGPTWPDMITKFVGDAAGGLIYVAGELHSQQLFTGGGPDAVGLDNSWLRALPVVVDPTLYQSAADVRLSARETWNLELTPEGSGDAIFRFAPDPIRNREILASLPGMYWHFPVTRAKQGATVLAKHGDPRMANQYGRHVLLATQLYGPGRTVFVGFDSTYRWRYLHEEYFDGFWARTIDRIGRNKVLGGRYPFTLATDKSVYRTGDQVTLRAKIISTGEEGSPITDLRGELELAGQAAQSIELDPSADQPGVLETMFTPEEPGTYMVRIIPNMTGDGDTALRPATLNFKVEPPRQELDNPTLNRGLLDDVARASGGTVFPLADYQKVPDAFAVKQVERVLEYRNELWDAPILFGGVIVLLTVEWVLRKRLRMA